MSRTLSQPVTVSFDYTRSTGPVIGHFLTGLRDRVVLGGRTASGRVLVPPPEFDPQTHAATTEFVEVGPCGVLVSWTWVPEPVAGQPFDRPFAWVLVTFDGADCPMLLALDAGRDEIETGMRVSVRWAAAPVGAITDIACVEPSSVVEEAADASVVEEAADASVVEEAGHGRHETHETPVTLDDPVTGFVSAISLDYVYAASPEESAFFAGLAEGRLIGQRCPVCHKVYVPPRGACPVDGVPTTDEVELPSTGTITTFCIVNVPFLGQRITPPYVSAYVLLDGADIAIQHLILEVPADEVRMGMRVEAVWRPREEWGTTIENIAHFRPTGEPDADYETYRHHL